MDEKITSRENAKIKYACRLASSGAFRRSEGKFLAEGRKLCPELCRGAALETLCTMRPSVLGASATLLILSDTKTIDQPRALAAVREAKRQAGRVIFLNPIPEGKWKYIRSVQTMASVCPMVSCSTLRELASACRRLTKEM